jgi:hypothetical protein
VAPGGLLNAEWTPDRVKEASDVAQGFIPVWGGVKGARDEWAAGNPGWAAFNAATVPLDLASLGGATSNAADQRRFAPKRCTGGVVTVGRVISMIKWRNRILQAVLFQNN